MFIVMPFNKFSLGLDAVLESTTLTNRKAKSKTQTHNDANPLEPLKVKKKPNKQKTKNQTLTKKTPTTKPKRPGGRRNKGYIFLRINLIFISKPKNACTLSSDFCCLEIKSSGIKP